jgi:hypothetical protein
MSDDQYDVQTALWRKSMYTEDGKTPCLGTSSVDSIKELAELELPCLNPVGTHAHELSMVISVLLPMFDKNKYDLPLTQIIGHQLYWELSAKKRSQAMFPMLPDTLGTAAFMKAATWVTVDAAPSAGAAPVQNAFLSLINNARQDSGTLENFKAIMVRFEYSKPMMASEIDNTSTLLEAAKLVYGTSGAGGFFGDSVKVWNSDIPTASMAVKAVNVEFCIPKADKIYYAELCFPHITVSDKKVVEGGEQKVYGHIKGYPIKVGDPDNMKNAELAKGKLSLDKTLPAEQIDDIMKWVSKRRVRAFNFDEVIKEADKIQLNKILIVDATIGDEDLKDKLIMPTYENLSEIRG